MKALDYWRICNEFTVIQAALLITGEDPAKSQEWVDGWEPHKRPVGYDAVRAALTHAIRSKNLHAHICYEAIETWDSTEERIIESGSSNPDWNKTTILLDDIRAWLRNRGFNSGFFSPGTTDKPDYLDPQHPRYAPKLAAAVNAWLALDDDTAIKGISPKKALSKWLREHAAEYKLSDNEGKPNETGIEECSKVANWQDKGGAPKTPSG